MADRVGVTDEVEDDPVVDLLRRTLTARAGVTASPDLALRARARRRRRVARRSGLLTAAAVAVAAAISGPMIFDGAPAPEVAVRIDEGPAPVAGPVYTGLPPVQLAAPGWRWETFGGVELQVPADWGTGWTRQPWCASLSEPPTAPTRAGPYVDRPFGSMLAVGCRPEPMELWGPYVQFASRWPVGREELGSGWLRETRQIGDMLISVRADDETLLERILASARVVDGVDVVGCPVDYIVTQSLDARPTTGALDPAAVGPDGAVCQYALLRGPTAGKALVASYRLSQEQVRAFVNAVAAAPVGGGPDIPPNCSTETRRGEDALLVRVSTTSGARDVIVWYSGCINGADDGVTLRTLTADVLAPVFNGAVQAQSFQAPVASLFER